MLFANDCQTDEDFQFGRAVIEEYIDHHLSQSIESVQAQQAEPLKKKPKKRGPVNWDIYYSPEDSIAREDLPLNHKQRNRVFPQAMR